MADGQETSLTSTRASTRAHQAEKNRCLHYSCFIKLANIQNNLSSDWNLLVLHQFWYYELFKRRVVLRYVTSNTTNNWHTRSKFTSTISDIVHKGRQWGDRECSFLIKREYSTNIEILLQRHKPQSWFVCFARDEEMRACHEIMPTMFKVVRMLYSNLILDQSSLLSFTNQNCSIEPNQNNTTTTTQKVNKCIETISALSGKPVSNFWTILLVKDIFLVWCELKSYVFGDTMWLIFMLTF